jgi:uncharacterized tellurite resistance protein B-like protein
MNTKQRQRSIDNLLFKICRAGPQQLTTAQQILAYGELWDIAYAQGRVDTLEAIQQVNNALDVPTLQAAAGGVT